MADLSTDFDGRGLATSASNAVGGESITHGYDAAGVTLTWAHSTIAANDWGYLYDAFSRLTCAKARGHHLAPRAPPGSS